MSEAVETTVQAPAKKRKTMRKAARKPAVTLPAPKNEFAGVTSATCCGACSEERCVISMSPWCKHPIKTGASGCGPITMANRRAVLKIIKHQAIDKPD